MNIEKRGKSFRITICLGFDRNRKRIREKYTFNPPPNLSARQAEQAAYKYGIELENKLKRGGSVKYESLSFNQFAEIYFKEHAPTLKEYTAVQYKDIYEKRIKPYFGNMRIKNITALDVRQWVSSLERSPGSNGKGEISDNTKGVFFRTLSSMLGVAVRWDIIDDNPCRKVKTPRSKKTAVKALQQEDFDKLFAKIDSYRDKRAVITIYLIALTGIREGEAAGLKWQDIDFENKVIHIEREALYIPQKGVRVTSPKSENSIRDIFISDLLLEKLKLYKVIQEKDISDIGDYYQDDNYIIADYDGAPVHASTIRKWLKAVCKHCDVPYVTVHGLRHTYASLLIANGVDVRTAAAQLGHSSPSLTMNVYANPQNEAKRRAGNLIADIAKGKK